MKNIIWSFLITFSLQAQVINPVKWQFNSKPLNNNNYQLQFNAKIDNNWHLYGTNIAEGGPIATSIHFSTKDGFKLIDKFTATQKPVVKYDNNFAMDIPFHSGTTTFTQKIENTSQKELLIKGYIEYMCCDDQQCLPPKEIEFEFKIPYTNNNNSQTSNISSVTPVTDTVSKAIDTTTTAIIKNTDTSPKAESNNGLLGFFILALIAGLAGTITPCVFPMIPMTVSFFLRGSENKAKAISKGLVFGISIISIYTLIGVVVSLTSIGADFASQLSTHWLSNSIFFILFLVFAASFFGMFELVLPSGIVNKADQQADKGGYIGIVFMGLVTVLVSFSCTGPIVGALLVQAAGGLALKPILGMFGFGLAFALPFTLFAIFPSALKALPKSGGWLNAVKVVFGFVLLALSLKFFANIDQTYYLGIISREVYIAIWAVLSLLLGMYILGKIKFAHDSDQKHISFPQLLLAIAAFTFSIYLLTGYWGNKLEALNALLPPATEQTSELQVNTSTKNSNICETPRFSDMLHFPYGIKGYFDYKQGLACAKKLNKPILLDFKGHACANCKKMEAAVWSIPEVQQVMSEKYVIIALYTDDRTELPENEWVVSKFDGKTKKTIGQLNSNIQIERFNISSQPYYVKLDTAGNIIGNAIGMELDAAKFLGWLKN